MSLRLAGLVALTTAIPLFAAHDPSTAPEPAARLRSRFAGEVFAVLPSDLDYVGLFEQQLGWPAALGEWQFGARTAIPVVSISGKSAFIVKDLDYRLEAALQRGASVKWAPFIALRGSEGVDRRGARSVVLAGLRAGQRDAERRLEWEAEAAAGAGDSGIEARATAGARGEWRALRRPRWEAGAKGVWDGIWLREPEAVREDLAAGAFLRLRREGFADLSFHALYFRGRHPLGLEETGVLAGLRIEGRQPAARGARNNASLQGALAAGGGNDRVRARQMLLLSSGALPARGRGVQFRLLAENILHHADSPDLYYILEGGIEAAGGKWRPGIHVHHRSGHLLGAENARRLALNLIEIGARSPSWAAGLPAWRETGSWGALDYEARIGGVFSSDFGQHQRWSARAGAVWTPPGEFRRLAPFVSAGGQAGEARGWNASAGAHAPGGFFIALAAERDFQRIDHRDTSWTVSIGRALRP